MSRIVGDNHHGYFNEYNLVEALNGVRIENLNNNLKEFIKFICKNFNIEYNPNQLIYSEYEMNSKLKQDLYLIIGKNTFAISLKMGKGNSVHQEKLEDFINYISMQLGASKEICDDIRFFIWADGTLDGTGSLEKDHEGKIISRFNATEFKKKYPEKRARIQKFLNEHEEELIRHFLLDGRHNSKVDIIYHGTPMNGSWITSDKVVQYQLDNTRSKNPKDRSCLSVGRMTLQAWNVSKKGTNEHKRGQIQLKYGKMKEDFFNLMKSSTSNKGTFFGNSEEFDISRTLNSNKTSNMWNSFNLKVNNTNIYAVKVETRVKSKLSNRLVSPKSDAYLIVSEIPEEYLLSKEYILTENDLDKFNYKIIEDSGISVKLKDSKSYTIQKFTKNSFFKAFSKYLRNNIELIFCGLLVYSNTNEISKNEKIFKDLNIDIKEFKSFYSNKLEAKDLDLTQKSDLDLIRRTAQEITKTVILENENLANAIFTGYGWFDDPYYANFVYKEGEINQNKITEFSITTGSGRSKGIYSIEIKPKL